MGDDQAVSAAAPDTTMRCPICGALAAGDLVFCEIDGARLVPSEAVAARAVFEVSQTLAAVTDRGKRHPTNQDAVVVAEERIGDELVQALVVCDGVSSTEDAEHASAHAAQAAAGAMLAAARQGHTDEAAVAGAIRQAHDAVCAQAQPEAGLKDPSGTTIVAALARAGQVSLGWVGDSRAYWLAPSGAGRLTRDHSCAEEAIASGELSAEDAYRLPGAHVITHCLGPAELAASDVAPEPSLASFAAPAECWLLLCSDGLWNYLPEPAQLRAALPEPVVSARSAAETLVDLALASGGQDNVSVALGRVT